MDVSKREHLPLNCPPHFSYFRWHAISCCGMWPVPVMSYRIEPVLSTAVLVLKVLNLVGLERRPGGNGFWHMKAKSPWNETVPLIRFAIWTFWCGRHYFHMTIFWLYLLTMLSTWIFVEVHSRSLVDMWKHEYSSELSRFFPAFQIFTVSDRFRNSYLSSYAKYRSFRLIQTLFNSFLLCGFS